MKIQFTTTKNAKTTFECEAQPALAMGPILTVPHAHIARTVIPLFVYFSARTQKFLAKGLTLPCHAYHTHTTDCTMEDRAKNDGQTSRSLACSPVRSLTGKT